MAKIRAEDPVLMCHLLRIIDISLANGARKGPFASPKAKLCLVRFVGTTEKVAIW
jgi:hypothetical protein